MSRAFQHETAKVGWMVPTAMQLVPVLMLAIGLPFAPGKWHLCLERALPG